MELSSDWGWEVGLTGRANVCSHFTGYHRSTTGRLAEKKTDYYKDLLSHWEKRGKRIWRKSHCASHLQMSLINQLNMQHFQIYTIHTSSILAHIFSLASRRPLEGFSRRIMSSPSPELWPIHDWHHCKDSRSEIQIKSKVRTECGTHTGVVKVRATCIFNRRESWESTLCSTLAELVFHTLRYIFSTSQCHWKSCPSVLRLGLQLKSQLRRAQRRIRK